MKNLNLNRPQQARGLTLVEILVAIALSAGMLGVITSAYVNLKVASQRSALGFDLAQDARWLATQLSHQIRSASTLAKIETGPQIASHRPECPFTVDRPLPDTVIGAVASDSRLLSRCLDTKINAESDILAVANDGPALFEKLTTQKTNADITPAFDLWFVEHRDDSARYGCRDKETIASLVRLRLRPGKRPYKEEMLPGVEKFEVTFGIAPSPSDAVIDYVAAPRVENGSFVRAVRFAVILKPLCNLANSPLGARTYPFEITVALRQQQQSADNET